MKDSTGLNNSSINQASVDLHVHTIYSGDLQTSFTKGLYGKECHSEPEQIYKLAKLQGMRFVTVTDHDTIEGALRLAHYDDFFISEEVTAFFPKDRYRVHINVLNISENEHKEIQSLKRNIYELVDYLSKNNIVHFVTHPLYSPYDLGNHHVEKLLLLFRIWEIRNGQRPEQHNLVVEKIIENCDDAFLIKLQESLGLPYHVLGRRHGVAGSDDHSGFYVGSTFTRSTANTLEDFLIAVKEGTVNVGGDHGSTGKLVNNIYHNISKHYQGNYDSSPYDARTFSKNILSVATSNSSKGETDSLASDFKVSRKTAYLFKRVWNKALNELSIQGISLVTGGPVDFDEADNGECEGDFQLMIASQYQRFLEKWDASEFNLGITKMKRLEKLLSSFTALHLALVPYFSAFYLQARDKRVAIEIDKKFDLNCYKNGARNIAIFVDESTSDESIENVIKSISLPCNILIVTDSQKQMQYVNAHYVAPAMNFSFSGVCINLPSLVEMLNFFEQETYDNFILLTSGTLSVMASIVGCVLDCNMDLIFSTDDQKDSKMSFTWRDRAEWQTYWRKYASVLSEYFAVKLSEGGANKLKEEQIVKRPAG